MTFSLFNAVLMCLSMLLPSESFAAPTPSVEYKTVDYHDVVLQKNGLSDRIELGVPKNAVSMFIQVLGDAKTYYLVYELESPFGRIVAAKPEGIELSVRDKALHRFPGQFLSPNRSGIARFPGFGSLLVPNNPNVTLIPGSWRLRVQGANETGKVGGQKVWVRVLYKVAEKPQTSGKLKLYFHFTGGGGITSSNAPSDRIFSEAITRLQMIYKPTGIDIEIAGMTDLNSKKPSVVDLDESESASTLCVQSKESDGIHVVFVDALKSSAGENVFSFLAASPTVGGPAFMDVPSVHRTIMVPIGQSSIVLSILLGHEIGHYLGLHHTVELSGEEDQLPETNSFDAGNLMVPRIVANRTMLFDYPRITLGQAIVLYNHPLVLPKK